MKRKSPAIENDVKKRPLHKMNAEVDFLIPDLMNLVADFGRTCRDVTIARTQCDNKEYMKEWPTCHEYCNWIYKFETWLKTPLPPFINWARFRIELADGPRFVYSMDEFEHIRKEH